MILRSIYGMKPEKRGHAQGHPEDQNWNKGANPGHLVQTTPTLHWTITP